jgi:hypothetical protein
MMARPLTLEFDSAIYHVTSRGNAREDIFDEGGDRERTDCPGVHRYGYSQREVTGFLDLHYATVSLLANRL